MSQQSATRGSGRSTSTANSRERCGARAYLRNDRLAHSHILVELRMPLSGRRCDALLTGHDTQHTPTAVVVELKAWTQVKKSAHPEDVAIGTSSRQHPSAQVRARIAPA